VPNLICSFGDDRKISQSQTTPSKKFLLQTWLVATENNGVIRPQVEATPSRRCSIINSSVNTRATVGVAFYYLLRLITSNPAGPASRDPPHRVNK
jgi:hypothetical protein